MFEAKSLMRKKGIKKNKDHLVTIPPINPKGFEKGNVAEDWWGLSNKEKAKRKAYTLKKMQDELYKFEACDWKKGLLFSEWPTVDVSVASSPLLPKNEPWNPKPSTALKLPTMENTEKISNEPNEINSTSTTVAPAAPTTIITAPPKKSLPPPILTTGPSSSSTTTAVSPTMITSPMFRVSAFQVQLPSPIIKPISKSESLKQYKSYVLPRTVSPLRMMQENDNVEEKPRRRRKKSLIRWNDVEGGNSNNMHHFDSESNYSGDSDSELSNRTNSPLLFSSADEGHDSSRPHSAASVMRKKIFQNRLSSTASPSYVNSSESSGDEDFWLSRVGMIQVAEAEKKLEHLELTEEMMREEYLGLKRDIRRLVKRINAMRKSDISYSIRIDYVEENKTGVNENNPESRKQQNQNRSAFRSKHRMEVSQRREDVQLEIERRKEAARNRHKNRIEYLRQLKILMELQARQQQWLTFINFANATTILFTTARKIHDDRVRKERATRTIQKFYRFAFRNRIIARRKLYVYNWAQGILRLFLRDYATITGRFQRIAKQVRFAVIKGQRAGRQFLVRLHVWHDILNAQWERVQRADYQRRRLGLPCPVELTWDIWEAIKAEFTSMVRVYNREEEKHNGKVSMRRTLIRYHDHEPGDSSDGEDEEDVSTWTAGQLLQTKVKKDKKKNPWVEPADLKDDVMMNAALQPQTPPQVAELKKMQFFMVCCVIRYLRQQYVLEWQWHRKRSTAYRKYIRHLSKAVNDWRQVENESKDRLLQLGSWPVLPDFNAEISEGAMLYLVRQANAEAILLHQDSKNPTAAATAK